MEYWNMDGLCQSCIKEILFSLSVPALSPESWGAESSHMVDVGSGGGGRPPARQIPPLSVMLPPFIFSEECSLPCFLLKSPIIYFVMQTRLLD